MYQHVFFLCINLEIKRIAQFLFLLQNMRKLLLLANSFLFLCQRLITIDINGLISALESQNHLYTGDLNKLFNPSNYLVSPFNSTGAFLDGKYFLTNQQEEFKTSVYAVSVLSRSLR